MSKITKQNSKNLLTWLHSLSISEYPSIKERIIKEGKIPSNCIFYNYKSGRTALPPLLMDVINKIAGKNIF